MGKSSDTERELKVFVLASHAKKHLNFKKLKAFKFWQSYFSDNSLEAAFRVVYKTNKDLPPLKTGRLRKVEISGKGSKYFATFKGPYLTEFSRAEYEQEISPQVYELLLPLCQGFTIRKTRYHLPGYIYLGKNKIPVQAEIDHLTDWSDDFYTVDIDGNRIKKSKEIFEKYLPDLNAKFYTEDSVIFCKKTNMTFNLVHLDSWDFDLKNPFPSALHGWREFDSLQDKTEEGGIIFVDDNFLNGSWIQWNIWNNNNEIVSSERIDMKYPIIGKGAHVYQYVTSDENWELLGNHYRMGENIKVIVKKNCKK